MVINIERVFSDIGLVFDNKLGTYIHQKTRIPLTVRFDNDKQKLILLDQTKLPFDTLTWMTADWKEAAFSGIRNMIVRGSQAIGIAAAYSMLLAANSLASNSKMFLSELKNAGEIIKSARPTAAPLMWAVDKTFEAAEQKFKDTLNVDDAVQAVKDKADFILTNDLILCSFLRHEGRKYLEDGDVILTHCNAGSLSSSYGGHALGMIEEAVAEGIDLLVISKETRPRSQGFKLTTWELLKANVPVIIITDNMISSAIKRYNITKIIVGADRVSKDGSLANKIGTHDVAIISSAYKIPFYVATGVSTFDLKTEKGDNIPIEERNKEEILYYYRLEAKDKKDHRILSEKALMQWPLEKNISNKVVPKKGNTTIYNPAFDITPPKLINCYITDIGTFKPTEIKKLTIKEIEKKVKNRLKKWGIQKQPII